MEKQEKRLSIGRINGVEISAVRAESGKIFVPVKPICSALGIDFKTQYRKIEEDPSFSSVMVIMTTTGADGKQYEMVCLPDNRINGWLYSINPGKVSPEARESVMRYRDECNDVLYAHFVKKSTKQIEANQAEIKALEEINSLLTQERTIKGQLKEARDRLAKIRSSRLDDQPSLFD